MFITLFVLYRVFEMTYTVSSGTLNSPILYCLYYNVVLPASELPRLYQFITYYGMIQPFKLKVRNQPAHQPF